MEREFPRPRPRGFTLVELLVTLVVAAAIMGIAIPSLSQFVAQTRVSAATSDLRMALHAARIAAVTRGVTVTVCKSAQGTGCDTEGGWDQGWMFFAEVEDPGSFNAGVEAPVRVSPGRRKGVRIQGNLHVADYVSYRPWGEARLASGALQMGRIRVCPARPGVDGRELVISRTGRVNVDRVACD